MSRATSVWCVTAVSHGIANTMTNVCNTHSPVSVTTTNSIISRTTFVPLVLNVYFLLAKKLNKNAMVVEAIFANSTGNPSAFRINSNPKSSAVLAAPTMPKRTTWALFLMVRFVILLDKIQRAVFGLVEYAADVFTNDAEAQQLNATEEQYRRHR